LIHNTFLIRISTKEILASTKYWPVEVSQEILDEYITTREELRSEESDDTHLGELALIIGEHKFQGVDLISDVLLLFVTDKGEDEASIFEKVEIASKAMRKELAKSGLESVRERYETLVEPSVTTRLKIALVGEGGVGKTTTLHLLLGDTPPLQYVPTIALNLETVENIRFGNYSLVLWDFAGQERFRTLWRVYFHGADVIFLVCDSALRNVIISKDILKLIKRDAPKVPVFALANKQDKPNAMKPEVVQKILGIPTYPMVAIDKARRDEMLRILMTAAAQYVGVALPDLPASELLKFTAAATEEAIAETDAIEERREAAELEASSKEDEYETIEVIEEVLVDEEGHVIENLDDYEIVEEVIEEVEDDIFKEEMIGEEAAVSEEAIHAAPDLADEIEEESYIPVIEHEVETEPSTLEVEFSDEHLIHHEIERFETGASSEEVEPSMSTDEQALTAGSESVETDDIEFPIIQQAEATVETPDIPSVELETEETSIKVDEGLPSIGFLEEELPTEEVLGIEPIVEENNGDVKLAKEIIFEALEADDFISAELDHVTNTEIDDALEAFKSDEAISTDGEPDFREEIDAESLEELELILGPLDRAVGGMKKQGVTEDEQHADKLPMDDESLDELSRLLDIVDSGEDEE
jgi:small GTP-binding protein